MGGQRSTRNGHHDLKCPSARRLCIVREDTGSLSEDATYAWMAADEAVGCTRAFLSMWRSSRRLVFVQIISLGSTSPDTSSQQNQSVLIDELLT
ncbi:uncharacterized protein TNCV_4016771 [Trichonephila clavipes]|nr:uncharacterized protein TNCV_4016771 [Trichonephila clavipes]